jgi:hypothetical protein
VGVLGLYEDFGGKVKGLGGGESISSRERRKNRSRTKSKAKVSAVGQKKCQKMLQNKAFKRFEKRFPNLF